MTAAPSIRRFGILIATASMVLTACSPSADGGSGPAVDQQQPVTTSTSFDFVQLGTFSVGQSPTNAVFSGGVATGGKWVIRDGDTGVVTFSTPTRDVDFTIEGLTPAASAALFAKSGLPRRLSKATCGVTDQGNDNADALGRDMFMRGGFNDWGNPTPSAEYLFVNFGGGIYQSEFAMTAGEYNYKVGSAGWEVERATTPDDVLEPGDTQPLVDPGPGGPEGVLNVPADGCYNFAIDFNDVENATITMTEVILDGDGGGGGGGGQATCGVTDQGNDNAEALGRDMFMRGGFNDWGNPTPSAEYLFVNFGGGIYQSEFEMAAGEYNYKVGSAGWEVERATTPDDPLEVDDTQSLVDPGPGGPEGVLIVPEDGCFNFTIDFNDAENPTITMTQVDLGGGGPPGGGKEECGLADQGNDNSEAFGADVFMRGGFNDWGNPTPSAEYLFINFGGGIYQSEFEMTAGEYNYKVADAGWSVERATAPDDVLEPGQTQALLDPGPGGPEGVLNVPADGCYNFTGDFNDLEAATITMSEVELGGGGGPVEPAATEVTAINTDGTTEEVAVEGDAVTTVSFTRDGRGSPVRQIEIFADNGDVGVDDFTWVSNPADLPTLTTATVFYHRADGNYADTFIVVDGQSYACVPSIEGGFGCQAQVPAPAGGILTFTVSQGGSPDPTGTFLAPIFEVTADGNNVYAFSGNPQAINNGTLAAEPTGDQILVYYSRADGDYSLWNMHLFPVEPGGPSWTIFDGIEACRIEGEDAIGAYFRITLPPNPCYDNNPDAADEFPSALGLVIHQGNAKAPDGDIVIRVASDGNIVFIDENSPDVSSAPPSEGASLSGRAAHWVDTDTLLWNPGGDVTTVELLWSADASIKVNGGVISGNFESAVLGAGTNPQPDNQLHLSSYPAYSMPASVTSNVREIARYQLVAVGKDGFGIPVETTYVQIPGLLDDLYAGAATQVDLGVSWAGTIPTLRLWAPTAYPDTGVTLNLYSAPDTLADQVAMTLDDDSGVWSVTGDASWDRMYYDFTLEVYTYAESRVVTNTVTDPNSVSLSANSVRSQIVNLDDLDLQPPGWDSLVLPAYGVPEDIAIYELQMRDFSVADNTVPEAQRGKYTAFALDNTDGHAHLQALADAGLTHLHLLPSFDIATINEIEAERVELDDLVAELCAANSDAAVLCPTYSNLTIRELLEQKTAEDPTSTFQQRVVLWMNELDGFNWGYDPWHYGVPEGSYASDPDGVNRIYEYREMVKGLADTGLRLVMDVVYNHTNAGGQSNKSVLDRVVPGYYHRYNENSGSIESSTCCSNTASEFAMMGKLMTDTLVTFLEDYKVTGFRFDLMGFHTKAQMQQLLADLRAIDPDVYIYGEGWNFGEVANDRRFIQATQFNMSGTGIATFTDRIRDAVRGGGPFDNGTAHVANQGFISGLGYDANAENSDSDPSFIEDALCSADQIRATMAASLSDYTFVDRTGATVTGAQVGYSDCESSTPTSYVADPEEIINYSAAHDNETIWDISQYKHPTDTSTDDRVRAQNIGLDIILLGQGVSFVHAGQDLLRSKSTDRDSFNWGDWFNKLDFSGMDNNWAVGLPSEEKNLNNYPEVIPLFENPLTDPTPSNISFASQHALEMFEIRGSTVLYRLRTADQIKERVSYFNTGPDQILGLVAQGLDGCSGNGLDPEFGYVMTIINANDEAQTLDIAEFAGDTFDLHTVQQSSVDTVVQTASHDANGFFVPARTTAVFTRAEQFSCSPFGVDVFVRGLNQDWADSPANQLNYEGGTSYTGRYTIAALTAADLSFKVASSDWATVNCGAGADPSVNLDVPYALNCADGSGDLALNVAQTGDVQISIDASDPDNPVLTATKAPPYTVDIFVRGFNGDWADSAANELAFVGNDSYQTELALTDPNAAGALSFKVASSDWATVDCGSNGNNVDLGVAYALNCAGGGDMTLNDSGAGQYSFHVDGTDPANPVLTVEKTPYAARIFVRGLSQDWSEANPLRYTGSNTYAATVGLTGLDGADLSFKIASSDWSTVDCGSNGASVDPGLDYVMNCAGGGDVALNATQTGAYDFVLDASNAVNPTLNVTGP